MKDSSSRRHELPAWFWLVLPLVLYFGHYLLRALLGYEVYDHWLTSELGFTAEATTLLAAVAAVVMVLTARGLLQRGGPRLALWFGVLALGCVYFAGEEASWGQHWFGWGTPELWEDINNQNETNFHNMAGWAGGLLDQLPRNLLGAAALIAGALMPLWRRFRGTTLTPGSTAYWVLPTFVCVPIGFLAALGSIPEKIVQDLYGTVFNVEAGEVKELLLAYFLLTYALSAWVRLRWAKPARDDSEPRVSAAG